MLPSKPTHIRFVFISKNVGALSVYHTVSVCATILIFGTICRILRKFNTDATMTTNELISLIKSPSAEDRALIERAWDFAKHAHEGQLRKSGEPYFTHVAAVAENLARFNMDAKTVAAGLLHDTIEDTAVTEDDVRSAFGDDVLFLVNGVSKLGTLKYRGRERHVESLRKFFVAMAEDVRVLIIKLADRLHNIRTLEHLPEDKRLRIALETIEIHAPLAQRMGMGRLKGELEDCAFPHAFPKEHALVEKLLAEKAGERKKELEDVHKVLAEELKKQGVAVTEIDYRLKHKYSLYKKLTRYDMDIEKIHDIVALRVIVPTVEDCYRVLGIVHTVWRPLPGRIKDYIAIPKPSGYQSLHTTIFTGDGGIAEIQIRTPEMHEEAEYGIASHLAYKEHADGRKGEHAGASSKQLAWINQMKELQKVVAEPSKFLEHLRMDFFNDRIFIFTPKGDVVDLPEDSSPIDFAYAIHSDIGDKMSGAKINGKMATLHTKLKNGDIVEIVTRKDAQPNSKWLDYAKTTLAKRHIRSTLGKRGFINKLFSFGRTK